MKRLSSSYDASVEAFRVLTAAASDGAATRARVLQRAGRRTHRVASRRVVLGAVGAVMISMSAAAAWIDVRVPWLAPHAQPIETSPVVTDPSEHHARRPARSIPSVLPLNADAAELVEDSFAGEARAYGRAHRLHFVAGAVPRALTAWNDYLRVYPRGRFAPEAGYNRALCLARLGRLSDAAHALQPFLRAGNDGYRRADAQRLLDWIHAQPSGEPR